MLFRKLVTPVIFAVAASVAAFILLGIFSAQLRDAESIGTETRVLTRAVDALHEQLAVMAEDNAWWDVAVDHLVLQEDIEWIDETLGESVSGVNQIQGVMVIRGDGSVIYSRLDGPLPSPHLFLDAGFSRLHDKLPLTEGPDEASTVDGLLAVDGRLIVFGASQVTPGGIKDYADALPEKRPAIIFFRSLSKSEIDALGTDVALTDLRYQPGVAGMADGNLVLTDIFGEQIGTLVWTPARPGMRLARDMIIPSLALLMLVTFAMARFVRRANRLVEQLAQANRTKSAFLASMSHEIRTPLNAILGFTELVSLELYGKVSGKKNKEYLRLIRDSGQHLLAIINDILDISKLEAGRYDIYAEQVCPDHVVASSLKFVEPTALDRQVTVSTDCEKGVILSDERIMRQVVLNILSNAVKFTEAGGKVMVTGLNTETGYDIIVTDTGIGMKQEEIELALALFGQVQSEYVRSHSGTGLGLPLVSRFMALLDGHMDIQSKPGTGTTVTLSFPKAVSKKNLPG